MFFAGMPNTTALLSLGLALSVFPFSISEAPESTAVLVPGYTTLAENPPAPSFANDVSPVGTPVRIAIPSIQVDTSVTPLGLTPEGNFDAPKHAMATGWYMLGPKPGEAGNAVIDGHLDLYGKPAIFYHLKKLTIGDTMTVLGDDGVRRTFVVRETVVYDVETAPLKKIFGKAEGKHLNLITCAGTWTRALGHYDKRLVVFADLVEE